MARVPYFEPEKPPEPGRRPMLNIARMMGHGGPLLEHFSRLGVYIISQSDIDPVLREIAIIRVGVLNKASYEVYQHERIGRREGMSDALIAAVHEGPEAAAFTELQRQVMRFTDDVVANVRASDATFEPLRAALPLKQLQELTLTVGYYMMVCRFLETFDVDLEPPELADQVWTPDRAKTS